MHATPFKVYDRERQWGELIVFHVFTLNSLSHVGILSPGLELTTKNNPYQNLCTRIVHIHKVTLSMGPCSCYKLLSGCWNIPLLPVHLDGSRWKLIYPHILENVVVKLGCSIIYLDQLSSVP